MLNKYSLLISAGEPSGDMHAANLVIALQQRLSGVEVQAMGGDALKESGAEILVDNAELAVMGLVEVIKHYPTIRRALKKLEAHLRTNPPDLLVLVDYVEFNLKLARTAKSLGIKVLFYVSPQIWAWRPKRVTKIGRVIDMMATIFPFEVQYYEKENIPARYVGNPLVGKVKPSAPRAALLSEFGLKEDAPVVSLQPGSRKNEIALLLTPFLESAKVLHAQIPNTQFIIPLAPGVDAKLVKETTEKYTFPVTLLAPHRHYDAMEMADAVLSASGTATLETALIGTPLLIAHRIAPISYAILKRLVNIPYIGLVNIVAERQVVKEFLQNAAEPVALAKELEKLLNDSEYRAEMIKNLEDVKQRLGEVKGSERVAELVKEMLTQDQVTS